MAINKKLIHFKTRAAFEIQLADKNILDTSIVFIQDANLIWTHGTYYCLPSDDVVISNGIEPDNDQDLWVDTSDDVAVAFVKEAPTDGKMYVRKNGAWVVTLNEVYVGETEPTNGEVIWINPDTDEMQYFNGIQWVTVSGKNSKEETLIINLASNQTNPDSNLNNVIVNVRYLNKDHKQAWAGEALFFKILDGTEYTIEYSDITDSRGNKIYTTPDTETYTAVGNEIRTLSRYYNSEKLTVNVSGVSSGFTVTVNGKSQTTTSETYYIPYDTAYTISASSVKGYNTEISESSITASQQTRTVTVTYTKIANGIYICDNTGTLTAVGSWDTSNNSSAIGVAVVSDNCSFVIGKTQRDTSHWSYKLYGTEVSGILTTSDSSIAKTDYAGEANSAIVRGLTSGEDNAFNWAYGNTITVNGTTLYGYIGAAGEWQTAYNNKSSIDSALSTIGGTAIKTNSHWTSTQRSSDFAITFNWSNGSVYYDSKNGGDSIYYSCAFYPLP